MVGFHGWSNPIGFLGLLAVAGRGWCLVCSNLLLSCGGWLFFFFTCGASLVSSNLLLSCDGWLFFPSLVVLAGDDAGLLG